jgi:hypothetical protein
VTLILRLIFSGIGMGIRIGIAIRTRVEIGIGVQTVRYLENKP